MIRPLLALVAILLLPAAYAHAHGAPHPVINGATNQGTVQLAEDHTFRPAGVTFDCPPPEGGPRCKIDATVRTRAKFRLEAGQKKRTWRIGRVRYTIAANGEGVELRGIAIDPKAHTLLERHGALKAKMTVVVTHHEGIKRSFKFTLKHHE